MRSRTVEVIIYQENAKGIDNCFLNSLGCDWVLSPLHNLDRYEDGEKKGELKKPHWHLLLRFKNARQFSAVAKDFYQFSVVEQNVGSVHSWNKAVRYLAHLDEVDKPHYDIGEIRSNIKDWQKFLANKRDSIDKGGLIADILCLVDDKNIQRFTCLVDEVRKLGNDYVAIVSQRAYFFVSYMKEKHFYDVVARQKRQELQEPTKGDYGYHMAKGLNSEKKSENEFDIF